MKLTFPLLNTTINVPVDDTVSGGKKARRAFLRKKAEQKPAVSTENVEKTEETEPAETSTLEMPNLEEKSADDVQKTSSQSSESSTQPLLMAEVVNVTHEKFRQTEEIKV